MWCHLAGGGEEEGGMQLATLLCNCVCPPKALNKLCAGPPHQAQLFGDTKMRQGDIMFA